MVPVVLSMTGVLRIPIVGCMQASSSALHTCMCTTGYGLRQNAQASMGGAIMITGCSALQDPEQHQDALQRLGRPTVLQGVRQQELMREHIDVAAGRIHVLPGDRPVSNEVSGPHSGACVCKQQTCFSGVAAEGST